MSDDWQPDHRELRPPAPERRTARPIPWPMIGGIILLAILTVVLAFLVLGGGAEPVASLAPSPSPGASASASASPQGSGTASVRPSVQVSSTPAAIPAGGTMPVGSLVEVTADGLRIRSGPSASSELVATLTAGEIVFVDGEGGSGTVPPVEAEGYAWYPVKYAIGYAGWPIEPDDSSDIVRGYLAARAGPESFVSLLAPECPADTTLATLVTTTPYARAACFGGQELQLEGTFGCPYCDASAGGDPGVEPDWLAGPTVGANLLVTSWATYPPVPGTITLAFPPETTGPTPEDRGTVIRVTGSFGDPRSAECRFGSDSEIAAEWYCRTRFVVESWEVIGTDPDFGRANPNG